MNTAVVIDTSREVTPILYKIYNIYPVGYIVEDSKGKKLEERTKIQEVQTSKLLSIVQKDKKTKLLAPSIKDFVELYTYLAEEYKSLISIHSSLSTPAVIENAILAKKFISDITIDIIDTQTLGSSSGIFIEELAKKIPNAENINEIRKEAIRLDKKISSYILTKNTQLRNMIVGNTKKFYNIPSTFKSYYFYQFNYGKWSEEGRNRISQPLIEEIKERVKEIKNLSEIRQINYSTSSDFSRDLKYILKTFKNKKIEETTPSLVSYHLLGKNRFDISYF
ncbi:MAG: DegV family protein [Candidatus Thorarchaeota archaeon]